MDKSRRLKKGKAKQPSKEISWSVFPSDVEENILSRLPAKSLTRFRCVCKHWCNLFTKRHFIKMQLNRSTQIKEISKVVFASANEVYSVDVGAYAKHYMKTRTQKNNRMQKEHMILPFRDSCMEVSGSCNGLIFLSAAYSLYLLNPTTKECKRLPYPKILHEGPFSSPTPAFGGFGYSPTTDEYKVIIIRYYGYLESTHSDVYVYTCGTNSSWRSVKGTIKGTTYRISNPSHHALVNGVLHWMATGPPDFCMVGISFDLGDEKFRELSLPPSFSQEDTNCPMELVALDGFLSLCHWSPDGNFDVWIMKDYGDEKSWTKNFSIAQPILSRIYGSLKPLCILKKDEVVLFACGTGFFLLDAVKKEIFHLHRRAPLNAVGMEMYLESLVSLRTDGGVDGSNEQERREKGRREIDRGCKKQLACEKEQKPEKTTAQQGDMAKWFKDEVDILVAIMVDEVVKGNKTVTTFSRTGWNNIKAQIDLRVGRSFTMKQLRNKFNRLRSDYNNFKRLLETTGFGWNSDTRTCTVDDNEIWERHIKENPTWSKFKRKGLSQWPELQIIYGVSYSTGAGDCGNAEEHNILNSDDDLAQGEETNVDESIPASTHCLDQTLNAERNRSKNASLVGTIMTMCDVSRARLDQYASPSSLASSSTIVGNFSLNECVKVLERMELDKDLYMKALDKMIENPTWREAFISVPQEKIMWLLERLP